MNIVITIKAWQRPGYFGQVVKSLEHLKGIDKYPILVSLDHTREEIQDTHIAYIRTCENVANYQVYKNMSPLGCAGNTQLVLRKAFEDYSADAIIHLEDDTVPARDYLDFMEWALDKTSKDNKLFAVCPLNRAASKHYTIHPGCISTAYLRAWFESGGGFGIPRRTWDLIEAKGGMFGTHSTDSLTHLIGEEWKAQMPITSQGSWAWPFNQYFRERSITDHLCIYPSVSRTNNIGKQNGQFNPNPVWHQQNVYDPKWIGEYKDELSLPIEYKLYSDVLSGYDWIANGKQEINEINSRLREATEWKP
jgi:hypothetical protein